MNECMNERVNEQMSFPGSRLVDADSSVELTDTGQTYSPGKFPHLAGCKVLTLSGFSRDQVC